MPFYTSSRFVSDALSSSPILALSLLLTAVIYRLWLPKTCTSKRRPIILPFVTIVFLLGDNRLLCGQIQLHSYANFYSSHTLRAFNVISYDYSLKHTV